jgi:hypothetical protein
MGSILVVILEIRPKYSAQMLFTKDNDMVGTFLPNASVYIPYAARSSPSDFPATKSPHREHRRLTDKPRITNTRSVQQGFSLGKRMKNHYSFTNTG